MTVQPGLRNILWGLAACLAVGATTPARAQESGVLGNQVVRSVDEAKTQATIDRLKKQLDRTPNDYRAWFDLGNAYYDLEDLTPARDAFRKAIEFNPKYLEAIVNLGSVYSDLNMMNEAIAEYEKALALDPEDCRARSNLGNAYYTQDRYADAMYEYRRAIEIDEDCYTAIYNVAVAFADVGLYREAINWWRKVVKVAPGTGAAKSALENIEILRRFDTDPSAAGGQE